MKLVTIEKTRRTADLTNSLTAVWESSVKATHAFLSAAEIAEIKKYVPSALENVPHLIVVFGETDVPLAFMGIDGRKIEMLFVAAERRGQGIGTRLIDFALARYEVNEVTVNEQNPQAKGFYEHSGFGVVSRSPTDEQGNPYPILRMRWTEQ